MVLNFLGLESSLWRRRSPCNMLPLPWILQILSLALSPHPLPSTLLTELLPVCSICMSLSLLVVFIPLYNHLCSFRRHEYSSFEPNLPLSSRLSCKIHSARMPRVAKHGSRSSNRHTGHMLHAPYSPYTTTQIAFYTHTHTSPYITQIAHSA